ncbi:hypothetical protein CAQU_09475 [Corynebacterium aquilae DSM 44791]|uniref:Uncharacterized protein n=1 Tax=Corynebacterium aquilae DSM 44791 TaxID=1431546 RepID=A0A1L7CHC7_9CORY|nr:hypothetical protein CAQU_09475 [Corynebacterium aquilae DSM 44791]
MGKKTTPEKGQAPALVPIFVLHSTQTTNWISCRITAPHRPLKGDHRGTMTRLQLEDFSFN